jgi:hypothetical protein
MRIPRWLDNTMPRYNCRRSNGLICEGRYRSLMTLMQCLQYGNITHTGCLPKCDEADTARLTPWLPSASASKAGKSAANAGIVRLLSGSSYSRQRNTGARPYHCAYVQQCREHVPTMINAIFRPHCFSKSPWGMMIKAWLYSVPVGQQQ